MSALPQGSLPHRQLRKDIEIDSVVKISSLPHRQLRNNGLNQHALGASSLPHRQLRKLTTSPR
ncbi:TPA: hypothetical protein I8Z92_001765 [Legionella pneumophila]|nr:hypothetical protein [Legionella pneumophila]